jgi:uncharacterized membrane-anchored protein
MEIVGIVAIVIAAILVIAVLFAVLGSLPDIARYLRIRKY